MAKITQIRIDRDMLFASVSHDIRNALTAMISSVELVRGQQPPPRRTVTDPRPAALSVGEPPLELDSFLDTALLCGRTIKSLIDNLLDMFKLETTNQLALIPTRNSLRITVEEAVKITAVNASRKSLYLRCEVSPSVPQYTNFDKPRLCQIFINLLSNAIKFTEQGGVMVKARWEDKKRGLLSSPRILNEEELKMANLPASYSDLSWDDNIADERLLQEPAAEDNDLLLKVPVYPSIVFRNMFENKKFTIKSQRVPTNRLHESAFPEQQEVHPMEGAADLCKRQMTVPSIPQKGLVHIIVKDTGIGMSREAQSRVFTPFSQVHVNRSQGGSNSRSTRSAMRSLRVSTNWQSLAAANSMIRCATA